MSDTPQYPDRPQFFAHRFCRLLTRAAVAQQVGPEACWLLAVIAHQEDTVRYRRAVTYFNEQLMPLCGFGGRSRLVAARDKAVKAGWLHYEQGGKGKPGIYWVEVPKAYQDVPDGPCDADSDEVSRPTSGRQPDGNLLRAVPNQDGNRTATGRQPDGKPAPSNPNPDPSPRPQESSCRTCRFDEGDRRLAEWMFGLIQGLDAKHKQPNFNKWANEIRLMRERDKRTHEEIRDVFAWANADSFWQSNVLSPGKLREKFSELNLKRKAKANGRSTNRRGSPAGRGGGAGDSEPDRIRERDWSQIPIISSDDPPDESDGRPVDP